ncbi:MAG: aldo/keto reductase [Leptospira sp.]|nr:aldo/keto reductase [Leptospira sp.]
MIPQIKIHSQGPSISRLVYGVWRINDVSMSTKDLQEITELCLELGIDWFDHADIYGDYSCEESFGKMLASVPALKSKIRLITKTDIMLLSDKFPNRKVKHYDTSPQHIQQSIDSSLKKIGVDTIDILLLHRPDPLMDADETGKCLDSLIQSGKIRYAGVSNFTPSQFRLLQSRMKSPLVTNQIEISLAKIDCFTNGDLDYLAEHFIKPMAWSPLGGGRLTTDTGSPIYKKLEEISGELGIQPNQLALAWLLRHPSGIIPVIGSGKLSRIREIAESVKVNLSREDWFRLYEAALGGEIP